MKQVTQKLAREIMGDNFFGIEESIKYFKVNELSNIFVSGLLDSCIPFCEKLIRYCRKTHVLIYVFPLTVNKIISVSSVDGDVFFEKVREQGIHRDRYCNQIYVYDQFENECESGWYLISKKTLEKTKSKTFDQQKEILSEIQSIPTYELIFYVAICFYLHKNMELFSNLHIRTINSVCAGGDDIEISIQKLKMEYSPNCSSGYDISCLSVIKG